MHMQWGVNRGQRQLPLQHETGIHLAAPRQRRLPRIPIAEGVPLRLTVAAAGTVVLCC